MLARSRRRGRRTAPFWFSNGPRRTCRPWGRRARPSGSERARPQRFPDVGTGLAAIEKESGIALASFIGAAETAITDVIHRLAELDPANVLDGIRALGGALMPQLARAGRIVALGIGKLERAISALMSLFSGDRVAKLRPVVEKFWDAVKGPHPLQTALRWAFGVEETQTAVSALQTKDGVPLDAIGEAVAQIEALPERFARTMQLIARIAKGVFAVVATLTALGAVSGALAALAPGAAAVALAAYVLLVAAVVALGMDYTDSGRGLGRVTGVGSIAGGLERR